MQVEPMTENMPEMRSPLERVLERAERECAGVSDEVDALAARLAPVRAPDGGEAVPSSAGPVREVTSVVVERVDVLAGQLERLSGRLGRLRESLEV